MFISENFVRRAIDLVGGPTYASNLCQVSNACIHKWIQGERVPNIDKARKLSELSGVDLLKLRPV